MTKSIQGLNTNIEQLTNDSAEQVVNNDIKALKKQNDIKAFSEQYQNSDYYDKKRKQYKLSMFVLNITQPFSAILSSVYVYDNLFKMTGSMVLSALFSFILVGAFEYSKRVIVSSFFQDFVKDSLVNSKREYSTLAGLIFCFIVSVTLSYFGGEVLPQYVSNEAKKQTLEQVEKVRIERLEAIEKDLEFHRANKNDGGEILWESREIIKPLNEEKEKLSKELVKASDDLKLINEKIETSHNIELEKSGHITSVLSVILEFCFIWGIWFKYYYRFRCSIRIKDKSQVIDITPTQKPTPEQAPTLPPNKDVNLQLIETIKHLQSQQQHLVAASLQAAQAPVNPALSFAADKEKKRRKRKKKTTKKKGEKPRQIGFFQSEEALKVEVEVDTDKTTQSADNEKCTKIVQDETKIVQPVFTVENSKTCLYCLSKYIYNHKKQKYCSDKCRLAYHNDKRRKKTTESK